MPEPDARHLPLDVPVLKKAESVGCEVISVHLGAHYKCCQAPDSRLTAGLKTYQPTEPKPTQAPVSTASEGDAIELEGRVVAVLPGTMFRVQLANGHIVLAHISGKLRKHYIKIAASDMVKMEMSPYDMNKARITFRLKEANSTYRPPVRRRY